MAVGDTKSDLQSIASAARLTIQPAAGEEWIIDSLFAQADAEIEVFDGTNILVLDTSPTTGRWWANLALRLTNGKYLRLKNLNAASKLLGYMGVQLK
jgi:hypothetical protein